MPSKVDRVHEPVSASKRWRIRKFDKALIAQLEREAGIPFVVAQLLLGRGVVDPDSARRFVDPKASHLRDPSILAGTVAAAARILRAVRDGEKITIYGDYDADGITAAAILWRTLRAIGAKPGIYVPHRLDEGYGLHEDAIRKLANEGTRLIVTVDCGIGSVHEARVARELGVGLIVTDHHEPGDHLPDAEVLVHPRVPTINGGFGELSGSGVAFKLAWEVLRQHTGTDRLPPPLRRVLLQSLGLAAIGTIADVVPLIDENRVLARQGLLMLRETPVLGLEKMEEVTGLKGKSRIECEDVGFVIGPRLNAAGRLGQAQLAVELLTTENPERAAGLAEYLNQLNRDREHLERSIYLAANKQAAEGSAEWGNHALVLAGRGWHPGVIGIVAGRLAEKYRRPVVLIAQDEMGVRPGIGSARSVPGFNLHQALSACSERLIAHGGHAAAAGLRVEDREVNGFRVDFAEYASTVEIEGASAAELWIDAEAPLASLTMGTVGQIEQLAPFGHGNPRPILCTDNVRLAERPKPIGVGDRHLSFQILQAGVRMKAVAFGWGERVNEFTDLDDAIAIAFRPIINEFRGRRAVEMQLVDWRPADRSSV